jgi:sulfite exporter TauE/SafE/copper chaperone CopZ
MHGAVLCNTARKSVQPACGGNGIHVIAKTLTYPIMAKQNYSLSIGDMQCAECEIHIEEAVSALPGVTRAKASFAEESLTLELDTDATSVATVCAAVKAAGYSCNQAEVRHPAGYLGRFITILLAAAGIVLLLQLDRMIGFDLSPEAVGGNKSYGLIFIVGLLTSLHCIGMCGGFVLSYAATAKGKRAYLSHLAYGLGKTVSYASMGAVFGYLGGVVSFTVGLRSTAMLLAGGFLIAYGLSLLDAFAGLRRFHIRLPQGMMHALGEKRRRISSPLLIGLLNGLMIACGPLQAMYIMAAGVGSALQGAAMLTAFALGTLPIMFVFGLLSSLISGAMTRRFLMVSGLIIMLLGAVMFNRGMALTASGYDFASLTAKAVQQAKTFWQRWQPGTAPAASGRIVQEGYQVIYTEAEKFEYVPKVYRLRKNLPVKWIIHVKELSPCNKRIVIPAWNREIDLVEGLQMVELMPKEAGTVSWSCAMGMIPGIFIVED